MRPATLGAALAALLPLAGCMRPRPASVIAPGDVAPRVAPNAAPTQDRPPTPAPSPVARVWEVMGTLLEVTVWEPDSARARAALAAARAAVLRVDTLMSVYKPESELSTVNRRAGSDTSTVVSPETAAVLEAALRCAELSGGALDVTVGPVVDAWGFYREQGAVPPAAVLDSVRALVGYRQVEYDPATRRVRLPLRGMRLDFGAVAKGYAVDRAIEAVRAQGIGRATVDLGGNLGFLGTAPEGGDWPVGVRDPREVGSLAARLAVQGGAVATSGDYERFFEHDGVRYSHIIDPRTGWPSRGVEGVTVVAPDGITSDALSTALFVLGPERGCPVARAARVEALWITATGAVVFTPGLAGRVELDRLTRSGPATAAAETRATACGSSPPGDEGASAAMYEGRRTQCSGDSKGSMCTRTDWTSATAAAS